MSEAAYSQAGQWFNALPAELVTIQLDSIIYAIDKADKDHTHPALTKARDQMEKEREKVSALIISVYERRLSDKEIGAKLTELLTAIREGAMPLAVISDKDKLAAGIEAFYTGIASKREAVYGTLPKEAVDYLKNLPGH